MLTHSRRQKWMNLMLETFKSNLKLKTLYLNKLNKYLLTKCFRNLTKLDKYSIDKTFSPIAV